MVDCPYNIHYKAYQSLDPCTNIYLKQKWDKEDYKNHINKIINTKCNVDDSPPFVYKHQSQLKNKEKKLKKESKNKKDILVLNQYQYNLKKAVQDHYNKEQIDKDNKKILNKLIDITKKSQYGKDKLLKENKEHEKFLKNISKYPPPHHTTNNSTKNNKYNTKKKSKKAASKTKYNQTSSNKKQISTTKKTGSKNNSSFSLKNKKLNNKIHKKKIIKRDDSSSSNNSNENDSEITVSDYIIEIESESSDNNTSNSTSDNESKTQTTTTTSSSSSSSSSSTIGYSDITSEISCPNYKIHKEKINIYELPKYSEKILFFESLVDKKELEDNEINIEETRKKILEETVLVQNRPALKELDLSN